MLKVKVCSSLHGRLEVLRIEVITVAVLPSVVHESQVVLEPFSVYSLQQPHHSEQQSCSQGPLSIQVLSV